VDKGSFSLKEDVLAVNAAAAEFYHEILLKSGKGISAESTLKGDPYRAMWLASSCSAMLRMSGRA